MTRTRIITGVLAALLIGGGVAAFAVAWRPAIAAVEPPAPKSFRPGAGQAGPRSGFTRQLQRLPHGARRQDLRRRPAGADAVRHDLFVEYHARRRDRHRHVVAGRFPVAPMRSGINREGPAIFIRPFPMIISRNVTDEDDDALYAYLMTRPAVHAPVPANQLSFPLDQRFVVAGWKLLFLRRGIYQPDSAQSAELEIAAPIWSKDWRIAAPATPRAMRWAPNAPVRPLPAAMSTTGTAYAINARSPLAGAVGHRGAVRLSAPGLASRSRCRARA